MGCIQTGRKIIINPIIKKSDDEIKDLIGTQTSTGQNSKQKKNQKRSTLKELSRLAQISKDIKIRNLVNLIKIK